MVFSAIHHTFGPHVDNAYLGRALSLLWKPWAYTKGNARKELQNALEKKFAAPVVPFASGREGLLALLRSLGIQSGDEIIIQGYTCMVLSNAIRAAGAVPVYADITEETLNLSADSVRAVLSPKTKVVICQHTFGIPAPLSDLRSLCNERSLTLIEDCAHVLPNEQLTIGTVGDFCLLSFGRDKAISGIAGGAIVCRRSEIASALQNIEAHANDLSWFTVFRLLLYAPRMKFLVQPFMGTGLLKPYLWLIRKIGWMVPVLSEAERDGRMPLQVSRLPNACAALALFSLERLPKTNAHRRELTRFYKDASLKHGWTPVKASLENDLPLQKFPLFLQNAEKTRRALKRKNIELDDGWTGCVVCPATVNLPESGYVWGSDPHAESLCTSILSLPTHPTMTRNQAEYLVRCLAEILPSRS